MAVLRFPEIRQVPNGFFFQPCPTVPGVDPARPGTPSFPSQAESAYFNARLYAVLGYDAPAYADLARQEMNGDKQKDKREAVEKAVSGFISGMGLLPRGQTVREAAEPAPAAPHSSAHKHQRK